ncbi:hypothetical protein [Neorhizobium galegae]|uniref:hypothetical protein n=1 Tax=Neorhizobium galegae TaxID=399 RepID=UPI00062109C3|nr:hypothetical protein [Neorhizobium galegae]KAB1126295.1 hypothetical protein F4V90_04045 [Neorhizobium galegae]MCQ1805265.1 hypothetical protein [Neorhizobium galegae]CDZ56027.1 Hypothetical protein NGAL_HAMBI2566_05770 [Neorhizobium galegae bv. orientalis]
MFANKTVFIIGAGASYEIGLPVGSALTGIIAQKLDLRESGSWDAHGDKNLVGAIIEMARGNNYGADMRRYSAAAQDIRRAMPQAISIDNFLHTHADDADIVTLGKMGIAASILEAENKSGIYRKEHGRYSIDFGAAKSWHNTFCKMLTENVQKPDVDTIFDKVAFITFNYDRCIEHYLSMWLTSYMRIPFGEACSICKKLQIFHPYGQVGKLPWQAEDGVGVGFGEQLNEYNIAHTAKQIRTFTERVDDDAMLGKMRQAISEATTVIYLGFAYAKMNMELMRLDYVSGSNRVYGTTFGMSESNKEQAIKRVHFALSSKDSGNNIKRQNFESVTANQLLSDHWYELSE